MYSSFEKFEDIETHQTDCAKLIQKDTYNRIFFS